MAVMDKVEKATDWYDLVCQELDELRDNAKKYPDQDVELPPDGKFEHVKEDMRRIRQLTGFPRNLPEPQVWLGPEGQIGITWDFGQISIDLVYGSRRFFARLTQDLVQKQIEPSAVPKTLADLAA